MATWSVQGANEGLAWSRDKPDTAELQDSLRSDGWTVEDVDGGQAYVVPGGRTHADGGKFGVDYYWEVDEAMEVAGR